jgi:hypothetical protein
MSFNEVVDSAHLKIYIYIGGGGVKAFNPQPTCSLGRQTCKATPACMGILRGNPQAGLAQTGAQSKCLTEGGFLIDPPSTPGLAQSGARIGGY